MRVQAGDLKNTGKQQVSVNFTENKGQVHDQFYKSRPDILFGGTDGRMVFHLKNNGISYQMYRVDSWKINPMINKVKKIMTGEDSKSPDQTTIYRMDINWLNANPSAEISHGEAYAGYTNYYQDNCPAGVKNVHTYADVTYRNLYPGIDLKWYQNEGHLKYDYIVSAGADYKKIRLEIKGAEHIHLSKDGQLILKTPLGEISEQAPIVTQGNKILPSKWVLEVGIDGITTIVSFQIENINRAEAFTIDPLVRVWGTYYGGNGDEYASGATLPGGDNYLSGYTSTSTGTIIATSGSLQDIFYGGAYDAFVAKFDASGQRIWATYYGGQGDDYGGGCDFDAAWNVVFCGSTNSGPNIMASTGSHQPTYGGNRDGFIAKLDLGGYLLWGSYYGGVGTDDANNCAVDKFGDIYMCGDAGSTGGIATGGSHQPSKGTFTSPYLVKFNAAGVRQWGTYYGGAGGGNAAACTVDKNMNVYFTGVAGSSTGTVFATPGTHQQAYAGGTGGDGFLAKFNASGVRQWGTFYGGTKDDYVGAAIADAAGNIYFTGATESTNGISTPGAHQPMFGGGYRDGFLVKMNASGQRIWSTYYGGAGADYIGARFDPFGNIMMSGSSSSSTGTVIATPGTYKPSYSGGTSDMFVAKFTTGGKRLWGTYYGGAGEDWGGIAGFDGSNNLYLAGYSSTSGGTTVATPGTHQPANGGGPNDAFLVKFEYCSPPVPVDNTQASELTACEGELATLIATASGTLTWYSSETGGPVIGTGNPFITPALTTGTVTYYAEAETCAPGEVRTAITITVEACTGLSQLLSADYQTTIYPNPFSHTIRVTSSSEELLPLKVFTATGSLVYESTIKKEAEVNLEKQAPGIYFVTIGTVSKKIVKE